MPRKLYVYRNVNPDALYLFNKLLPFLTPVLRHNRDEQAPLGAPLLREFDAQGNNTTPQC
jgi:hypothetical protein